jgi:hypothetical protein
LSTKDSAILHKVVDYENWANDINVERIPHLQKSLTDLRRRERDEKDIEEPVPFLESAQKLQARKEYSNIVKRDK